MTNSITPTHSHTNRIERLQNQLAQEGLGAMLVSNLKNIKYLTGFGGTTGYLVLTPETSYLYVDARYTAQARSETERIMIKETVRDVLAGVISHLKEMSPTTCGFESSRLVWSDYQRLEEGLTGIQLVPTSSLIETMRYRKDKAELAAIRQAVAIADAAYADFLTWVEPGMLERDVAARLEYFQRSHGGDRKPSETVVASGSRTAYAHGIATERVIQKNEPLMIDIGIVVGAYTSDLTRTIHLGQPSKEFTKVYEIVLDAQAKAIEALRPGMTGREVDSVARSHIESHGYGSYFGHGLGHSLGLEIHEAPYLSTVGDIILKSEMVVTIEPGIYLPGRFGVRTEDVAVVTEDGCEILTRSEHDLQIL